MTIEEWRLKYGYSYELLARKLGMTTSKLYRVCKNDPCVRLSDASRIVKFTEGKVGYEDFMLEGC